MKKVIKKALSIVLVLAVFLSLVAINAQDIREIPITVYMMSEYPADGVYVTTSTVGVTAETTYNEIIGWMNLDTSCDLNFTGWEVEGGAELTDTVDLNADEFVFYATYEYDYINYNLYFLDAEGLPTNIYEPYLFRAGEMTPEEVKEYLVNNLCTQVDNGNIVGWRAEYSVEDEKTPANIYDCPTINLYALYNEFPDLRVEYSYKAQDGSAVTTETYVPVSDGMSFEEIMAIVEEELPETDNGTGWAYNPSTTGVDYSCGVPFLMAMRDYEGYTEAYANIIFVDKEGSFCGYDTPFYIEGNITDEEEIAATLEVMVEDYMEAQDMSHDLLEIEEYCANGTFGGENENISLAAGINIQLIYKDSLVKLVYPDFSCDIYTAQPGEVIELPEEFAGKEITWDASFADDGKVYAEDYVTEIYSYYTDGSVTVRFCCYYHDNTGDFVENTFSVVVPEEDDVDSYMSYFYSDILPTLSLAEDLEVEGWLIDDIYFDGDKLLNIYVFAEYPGESGGSDDEETYPETGYVGVEYEYVNKDGKVVIDHTSVFVDGSDELAYIVGPIVSELDHYSEPISYRLWVYLEGETEEPIEIDVDDFEIMTTIIDGSFDGYLFIAQALYEDIEVCDHRMEYVEGVDATVDTTGYKQYFKCRDCDLKYYFNNGFRVVFEDLSEIAYDYIGVIEKEDGKAEVVVSDSAFIEVIDNAEIKDDEIIITLDVSTVTDKTVSDITLPENVVEELVEAAEEVEENVLLIIELGDTTVTLDMDALEASTKLEGNKTLSIVIEENSLLTEKQEEALEDGEVVLYISASWVNEYGEYISDFEGGNITIALNNFEAEEGKELKDYVVVYIAPTGEITIMPSFVENDTLCFTTTHFSDFGVMDKAEAEALVKAQNALPETSDGTPVALLVLLALVSYGAIIVAARKKFN